MAVSAESSTNTLEFGSQSQNLVSKKRTRYGKVILIFVIVGILLLGCVLYAFLQRDSHNLPEAQSQKVPSIIDLHGIITGAYEPFRFNGTWISDDQILMANMRGHVVLFNVTDKSTKKILDDKSMIDSLSGRLELSADKRYLMIPFNSQKIYRHSYFAFYLIYDIETQKKTYIIDRDGQPLSVQLVLWAPQGNGFAYVSFNDIYYKPSVNSQQVYRITDNGNHTTVYNGLCDWVYEEEIFSDTKAMWFSPDGKKLAYATFDDSKVDTMTIPFYGEPGAIDSQYPGVLNLRYPKPGRQNPTFSLNVAKLTETNGKLEAPKTLPLLPSSRDPILNTVAWISDNEVSACVMNRVQNQASIFSCDADSSKCELMLDLNSSDGWIEFNSPIFSSDGQKMLFIKSQDQGSGLGSYRHVVLFDRNSREIVPLTSGKFTVIEILAWNQNKNEIYFTATEEDNPINQHVFMVKNSQNDSQKPKCLSCKNEGQEDCTFASVIYSTQQSYRVQTCNGPGVPTTSIYDQDSKLVLSWEDNKRLRKLMENATLPKVEFLRVPVAQGMEAQVKLLLPNNLDRSGNKKYPLLVNVYGGPNSNQVFNRYRISWETYFSVQNDAIIAYIDGRGSGLKGDSMLFANYRKLGSAEIIDQLNVTYYLQNKYPFIDRKRSAIWGWSYGGYATGMALASDVRNVFKCGASVAPVTDWIYYDSIYTERYLGLPTDNDNRAGYLSSSLVNKSKNLANKMYLLVHGTLDDNVHYQQSMMLSRSLELHDILFKQQSYPDEAHGLSAVRFHFYHTLEQFLRECFA
ncbi:venom dipeptidyl peptidase 4 isoform X2 [Planococcus citri]|uniref:venom dipeptidyl peptidase 4 isoform X2 n=1 Tax=Planococcus citri TaxID=170843 RepID=UPI0031F7A046